ncbi:MAG: YggT family protein [Treponema sp.]|jgi:YggT family protein|nr:YggT family protein [Treponema sp.]
MYIIMNILSGITGIYMILIFIRIMLTWFSGAQYGRPMEILSSITDVYLHWFRRFPGLRVGFLDLSPIVAMAVLSLVHNLFATLGRRGYISLGMILGMLLSSLWSAGSFILGFCIVILILRLIAYLTNRNIVSSFWGIIHAISQPILYRMNRFLFRNRLVHYRTGLLTAIGVLAALLIGMQFLVAIAISLLLRLPI